MGVMWVAAVVVSLVAVVVAARGLSRMHGGLAISPGNPWNCVACAHLPAAHEDGRGGLGPCWGWPASERRWWRPRGCDCAGYVAREHARRLFEFDEKYRRCETHNRARYWCGCWTPPSL